MFSEGRKALVCTAAPSLICYSEGGQIGKYLADCVHKFLSQFNAQIINTFHTICALEEYADAFTLRRIMCGIYQQYEQSGCDMQEVQALVGNLVDAAI